MVSIQGQSLSLIVSDVLKRRVMEIMSRVFKGLRPSGRQILKPCGRKTFNFVFEHLFKIVYLHIKLDYPYVDSINYFLNTYL